MTKTPIELYEEKQKQFYVLTEKINKNSFENEGLQIERDLIATELAKLSLNIPNNDQDSDSDEITPEIEQVEEEKVVVKKVKKEPKTKSLPKKDIVEKNKEAKVDGDKGEEQVKKKRGRPSKK